MLAVFKVIDENKPTEESNLELIMTCNSINEIKNKLFSKDISSNISSYRLMIDGYNFIHYSSEFEKDKIKYLIIDTETDKTIPKKFKSLFRDIKLQIIIN